MDQTTLQQLSESPLSWQYRAIPFEAHGLTPRQWLDSQPHVSDLPTPVATLSESALRQNLHQMAQWADHHNFSLAPHGKATMAPQLWARQLAGGAVGMTVANVAQARVAFKCGVRQLIIANQVVDPRDIAEISTWVESGIKVCHWVDSPDAVAALSSASVELSVCVEWGAPGGRSGARSLREALEVAALVHAHPKARLIGVAGYEGVITAGTGPEDLTVIDDYLDELADLYRRVEFATERPMISAGGSAYFDRVANRLGHLPEEGAEVVVRAGSYVAHDHGFYARLTPSARSAPGPQLRAALRSRSQVLSLPEPQLAIINAGRRDLPCDQGLPIPLGKPGLSMRNLSDQHGYLEGDTIRLSVGDVVELGISHPCTAFDKWNLIPVIDDQGTVVDLMRTYF